MPLPPFHLAIVVHDLASARGFYGGALGCRQGRSSARWADFDFYGHQLVVHVAERAAGEGCAAADAGTNVVDGDDVPAPHFGVVLAWGAWETLAQRLRAAGVAFVIAPRVRFAGQVGEQGTFFVRDPGGNALEFKAFRDPGQLFARRD
jgi:hypothetical protein